MEEYLSKIKALVSQLALASVIVEDEDLVLITLNGLPSEYDAFTTAIRARSDTITMDDLSSLLCSEAIHVEAKHKIVAEPTVAFSSFKGSGSVNSISQAPSFPSSRGRSFYRGRGRGGRTSGSYRGNSRYYNNNRGKGRSFNHVSSTSGCQI